ncbi:MAG: hypothetical protein ACRC6K_02460 [Fusobacteriaceae bacterium]
MKAQKINANNLTPMEMNNVSSMMGAMNLIQKIGKGKRKYNINLEKADKKFLSKFLSEAKKQFSGANDQQVRPLVEFFDYVKGICDSKDKNELRLSYEEMEFLKKILGDSIKGMESMSFKWYQLLRKSMVKVMIKQYRALLKKIN